MLSHRFQRPDPNSLYIKLLKMAQNIYDSPAFFTGYSSLPRSQRGLDGMPEWPSLRALLPRISTETGHVLDLGCGYGWLARWLIQQGAKAVTGVEISEMMIARAEELGKNLKMEGVNNLHDRIRYIRADLENVELIDLPIEANGTSPLAYDLVVSQLALHYITTSSLSRLLGQVFSVLLPGGKFVFSVEHPIFMAPTTTTPEWISVKIDENQKASFLASEMGTSESVDRGQFKKAWPLEGYSKECERRREWFDQIVLKQHRMLGTWVKLLVETGFIIEVLEEWTPTNEQLQEDQDSSSGQVRGDQIAAEGKREVGQSGTLWEVVERPMFLLVRVGKPFSYSSG